MAIAKIDEHLVLRSESTKRRRDELIDHAAVCWLEGNSHDTEPHHLGDALRRQLRLRHGEFKVVKHFPEQYFVTFSDPAIRQRLVGQEILSDNGRDFHFAAWSERRYANNVNWEYRVKVRIEGIPVHCWAEDVAAKALGKSCAVHYVEETTRHRERTRSFDLWAWCSDPSDIPTEVWLTVTEPDREPPHHDEPVDLKRGHVYVLRNHLEIVDDLSFLQGRGRVGGPPNRKPRREFIWSYGAPDTEGERLHGRRGNNRGRELRRHPRRDDDDYEDRRNHGMRRHRSLSGWARSARCRTGAEDCISSNRWGVRRDSPPRRSRANQEGHQRPNLVWKVKGHDEEKRKKKVTFAEPIATELKATLPDDSIILMKDQCSVLVEAKKQEMQMVDGNPLNMDFTPTDTKPTAGKNAEDQVVEQHDTLKNMMAGLMLDQLQNLLHFGNPIEKSKMEAIQVLIEQGAKMQNKDDMAVASSLVA
ncbi:uncharacterized protein LOC110437212 [Sorghum bicolor]|uniref:uncharacterized protein LOC110437212 n=1 Tax=Sorghum bicolor TaxID=4558 RepID=UPI000B423871|nr:uncharacterized protein LOC110437212 [Sorghum bicolor]|eukprot:XP_021321248.1 uncharacterized protein LOC110437212 [Sorghum bicolor]